MLPPFTSLPGTTACRSGSSSSPGGRQVDTGGSTQGVHQPATAGHLTTAQGSAHESSAADAHQMWQTHRPNDERSSAAAGQPGRAEPETHAASAAPYAPVRGGVGGAVLGVLAGAVRNPLWLFGGGAKRDAAVLVSVANSVSHESTAAAGGGGGGGGGEEELVFWE